MKRIVTALLAAVTVCLFCSCKSSDYKKAAELYEQGSYEEAKAIFAELGDYEDSVEYVKKCDYHEADALLEADEYESAQEIFESLKDFEDSKQKVKECKWIKLFEYIKNHGDYSSKNAYYSIKSKDSNYEVELRMTDENTMSLYFCEDHISSLANLQTIFLETLEIKIVRGNSIADFEAYFGRKNYLGNKENDSMTEKGSGTVDLSAYKNNSDLNWKSFSGNGKNIWGEDITHQPGESQFVNSSDKSFDGIISHIRKILSSTGLDITLADLGFEAI